MDNIGYIYLITNKINGKKYIGQTKTTIQERWRKHCSKAKNESKITGIDGAIRKYGIENFSCEKIKECPVEELNKWEQYYILYYDTYQGNNLNRGYNLTLDGDGSLLYIINEKQALQMYKEGKTMKEIGQYFNCSDRVIKARLQKYNIDTKQHQKEWLKKHPETWKENLKKGKGKPFQKENGIKSVYLIELDKKFSSLKECSQWLLDNKYTSAKNIDMVRKSLSRHLNGDRKSYLGMHFKFI